MRITDPSRRNERGVTVLIVGITLLALIAMAALAIDVASLYQARGEAQRAADAAALAGARMFVSSSFISRPGIWDLTTLCENSPSSTAAVNQQVNLAAATNSIAGQPATITSINCDFDNLHNNTNPRVTVTVGRTGAPAFFSRIFGPSGTTVSATATAEAYRPSEQSTVPLEMTAVKPMLVSNCDPSTIVGGAGNGNSNCPAPGAGNHYDFFIKPDGSIANGGSFIGKKFCFRRVGVPIGPPVDMQTFPSSPVPGCPWPLIRYYGMNVPIDYPTSACPSTAPSGCDGVGSDSFVSNVACASSFKFRCTQQIAHGTSVSIRVDGGIGDGSRNGARCLIHADHEGLSNGQDIFNLNPTNGVPVNIVGGNNNPNLSLVGKHISRSDSIATVPIYDAEDLCPGGNCNLGNTKQPQGFLQIAITQTMDFPQHFEAVILNASGCNASPSGTPITSAGSPIAVRLIKTP